MAFRYFSLYSVALSTRKLTCVGLLNSGKDSLKENNMGSSKLQGESAECNWVGRGGRGTIDGSCHLLRVFSPPAARIPLLFQTLPRTSRSLAQV